MVLIPQWSAIEMTGGQPFSNSIMDGSWDEVVNLKSTQSIGRWNLTGDFVWGRGVSEWVGGCVSNQWMRSVVIETVMCM